MRIGVPMSMRREIWLAVSGGLALKTKTPDRFKHALHGAMRLDPSATPEARAAAINRFPAPTFGYFGATPRHCLTAEGLARAHTAMCAVAYDRQETVFCPWVPLIVLTCMHWMDEADTFFVVCGLLREPCQLLETRIAAWLMVFAFDELARTAHPRALQRLCAARGLAYPPPITHEHPLAAFWLAWPARMPLPLLTRFVDVFMTEGIKIVYRAGLAVLSYYDDASRPPSSSENSGIFAALWNSSPSFSRNASQNPAAPLTPTASPVPAPAPAPMPDIFETFSPTPFSPRRASAPAVVAPAPLTVGFNPPPPPVEFSTTINSVAPPVAIHATHTATTAPAPVPAPDPAKRGSLGAVPSIVFPETSPLISPSHLFSPPHPHARPHPPPLTLPHALSLQPTSPRPIAQGRPGLARSQSVLPQSSVWSWGSPKPTVTIAALPPGAAAADVLDYITDWDAFLKKAFGFRFSRASIRECTGRNYAAAKAAMTSTGMSLAPGEAQRRHKRGGSAGPPVDIAVAGSSTILNEAQLLALWAFVPTRFHMKEIHRVFTTHVNGYSLSTLLSHAADEAPTVLLVRTTIGDVFGAYCSYPWNYREEEGRHYGNGEMFVFHCERDPPHACTAFPWVGLQHPADSPDANLFMIVQPGWIGIGGGPSGHAIHLDADLSGHSQPSPTFGNASLARSPTGHFTAAAVELWAFRAHH